MVLFSGQESGIFTEQHFAALVRFVDYINVMTYDFPDRKIGPVAPLDWVRKCVEWLLSGNPDAAPKLLMGLNFYGHERRTKIGSAQPVTGNDFVALLKSKTPEIFWHRTAAEHYVQSDDHICYYPSLASVEARLKLAKELNVGVGIWEIGQGLDYFYNLF
uniref:Chitinase domain-containing protein 1 n=1 Tax=Plectus sambesii TaxID=2011161 RepID=A0A914WEL0_9BILA